MTSAQSLGTILFVDDEPNITEALRRSLRTHPYTLLTATSAAEGLAVMEQRTVDIVVSDEQMPGMAGSEFLSIVRTRNPGIIRIILSGHASFDAALRAINEGEVYRFLVKPCSPTDLIGTIHQALAHKRLLELSRRLLQDYKRQSALLAQAAPATPAIRQLETDVDGAIVVDEADGDYDIPDLLTEMEKEMEKSRRRDT